MLAVDDFLAGLPPEKGKLVRWEKEIFQMYAAHASYRRMSEFLALQGVTATRNEIYRFIHREKRKHLQQQSGRNSRPASSGEPASPKNIYPARTEAKEKSTSNMELPKFDWQKIRENPPPEW